jgi:hypothetical protein
MLEAWQAGEERPSSDGAGAGECSSPAASPLPTNQEASNSKHLLELPAGVPGRGEPATTEEELDESLGSLDGKLQDMTAGRWDNNPPSERLHRP